MLKPDFILKPNFELTLKCSDKKIELPVYLSSNNNWYVKDSSYLNIGFDTDDLGKVMESEDFVGIPEDEAYYFKVISANDKNTDLITKLSERLFNE